MAVGRGARPRGDGIPRELLVTSICHGCKQDAEGDVIYELGNER